MKLNKKIKSSIALLTTVGITATVAIPLYSLTSCSCSHTDIISEQERRIFNISGDEVRGFNSKASEEEIIQYIKQNKCLKLPHVKKIGDRAFESLGEGIVLNKGLKVEIPNSVTEVGDRAFYNNQIITECTYEDESQCHTIGKSAFAFCKKLTTIKIPAKVYTSDSTKGIKEGAFFCCSSANTIDLTSLPSYTAQLVPAWAMGCFAGISATGKILNPYDSATASSISVCGEMWSKLVYCGMKTQWTQNLKDGTAIEPPIYPIPYEFFKVENNVLTGYYGNWTDPVFTVARMPNTIKTINFASDADNFFKIANLPVKHIYASANLEAIPDSMCENISLPNCILEFEEQAHSHLTQIGKKAFYNAAFSSISFDDSIALSVTSIGESAFESTNLPHWYFNKDVTVGNRAFASAKKIIGLHFGQFKTNIPTWTGTNIFTGIEPDLSYTGYGQIVLLSGTSNPVDSYRLAIKYKNWITQQGLTDWTKWRVSGNLTYNDLFNVDDNGVCHGWIKDTEGKFITADEIKQVMGTKTDLTFPTKIKSIADNAFYDTTNNVSTIPSNITSINLSGSMVTSIGKNAFAALPSSVASLTLSSGVLTSIGESAFRSLPAAIQTISLPVTLTNIGRMSFYGNNAKKIILPVFTKADLQIGDLAFAQDTGQINEIDITAYTALPQWKYGATILAGIASTGTIWVKADASEDFKKDIYTVLSGMSDEIWRGTWVVKAQGTK